MMWTIGCSGSTEHWETAIAARPIASTLLRRSPACWIEDFGEAGIAGIAGGQNRASSS
ncbi:hypothetical protein [Mesorhizobium captivum]|uniref:hypothetical protein n=1 Tax=Mesorhizobium captivum TaxID=3072319 RepID=UPI002A23E012|nr:hypothetical protein [Mesorhizobium sp. VK23E]MDX8514924.1 hypothetical protein [Mesorhizobium sp. VK23E]